MTRLRKTSVAFLFVLIASVLVGIGGAYAAQSAPLGGGNGPGDAVPGEYIVVLQPDADAGAVAEAHGIAMGRAFGAVFNGFAGKVPPGRIAALRSDPGVLSVSPNRVVSAHPKPDKPPGKDKGNGGGGQVIPSGVARIGAAPGSLAQTGAGVGVAIVDTGIDLGHLDLAVAPECFTAYTSCQDDDGHGTHVAGIVAALNNSSDVVGVAPGATTCAVKVLDATGSGTDATVIAGLDWVLSNANSVTPPIRVVNMSLGRPASSDDSALHAAVAALYGAGITVVVSAGNDPTVEATDNVPAGFSEVMAIASTTAQEGKRSRACGTIQADSASYFTTDGLTVAVSAPGEAKEDIRGCTIRSVGILSLQLGGGTTRMSGTSMSAPHATGVVALLWDQADDTGGTLSPSDARSTIGGSADRIGVAPLNSPTGSYSFDGVREGVLDAAGALAH